MKEAFFAGIKLFFAAKIVFINGEIFAFCDNRVIVRFLALNVRRVCACDHSERIVDVKGAELAVRADSVVIVNAVRDVGVLLDFRDEYALTDSVNKTRGDKERERSSSSFQECRQR